MKSIKSDVLRFLIGGAANTALSYLTYLVAILFLPYAVSFCISFIFGIIFAFVLNSRFVFRTHLRWAKLWGVSVIYLAQAFLGLMLLTFWIETSKIDKRIAPLLNVAILTPATFLSNRWYLKRKEVPQ